MTNKQATKSLLAWHLHLVECMTCRHGIGRTCTRCFYGEDLEKDADKAIKILKKVK